MPPEPAPQAPTVWTIQALLKWTADYLRGKGVEAARLESEVLLAHVLTCPRIELIARSLEVPADADRARFRELIKRRVEGWPVAYLVGTKEFYLLKFEVSPAVLVPRPETETLVMESLRLLNPLKGPTVLDLGTGSGCIAVSIAHQKKDARVTATDISPDALDVAKRNAEKHGVADRVTFLQGDLFAPVPAGAAFDLVVSNPPYVTPAELAALSPDVREHEPRLALDGGPDGLAFYRRIASGIGPLLKPGGSLLVEIGATQDEAVRAILGERAELDVRPTLRDGNKLPRVVTAKKRA
jgi:release factor glutamine methyltransferase